jgi:omega-amidase
MSTLTFTLIQTQLHWENKTANLEMLQQKINSIKEKTEVVVLPEMFTTGFSMKPGQFAETMDGITVAWMQKIASSKKIILTGSIIIEENKKYYNRLLWVLPNGETGIYDKRHLFAFGNEDAHYTAGSKRLIASAKGWKINLQVCYDLRFPVWARQQKPTEYDVLIYVANWPARRNNAWKTLLQARAIENQSYVIGVNRTGNDGHEIYHSGDSMVIDPLGKILYHKENDEDIFTIALEKEKLEDTRNKFPFLKDADDFFINNA